MTRTRRSRIVLLIVIFVAVMVFMGGCRKAGIWLVKDDHPGQADVMVMLMGSIPDRVLQVADLFDRGISGRILMVEESMGDYRSLEERGVQVVKNSARAGKALVDLGIPEERILIIPGETVSTQEEAIQTRDYLGTHTEIKSVLLVSSSSHMRRASIIFTSAFKQMENPVTVYSSPSSYTKFNPTKWWRHREDIQHVVMEYMKMGSFQLFDRRKLRK